MANEVFKNDTSITLDWANVTGTNFYQCQVSVDRPDFGGTLLIDDNSLTSSLKTFTDSGTNDRKRYWRWRYSTDGGTTWSEWSEVGSYWLNSAASGDVTLSSNKWAMFDPAVPTDIYTFGTFPFYSIVPSNIFRFQQRNRLGTLLSEYLTKKDTISLDFSQGSYVDHQQSMAFRRFNETIKTFFLACYKSNETDTVPNIWKVQFAQDPMMTMIASGRPGIMVGSLNFMEV